MCCVSVKKTNVRQKTCASHPVARDIKYNVLRLNRRAENLFHHAASLDWSVSKDPVVTWSVSKDPVGVAPGRPEFAGADRRPRAGRSQRKSCGILRSNYNMCRIFWAWFGSNFAQIRFDFEDFQEFGNHQVSPAGNPNSDQILNSILICSVAISTQAPPVHMFRHQSAFVAMLAAS